MAIELDEYDWFYAKFDIWAYFVLSMLLWPVTALTKPQRLFNAKKVFDFGPLSIGIQNQREQNGGNGDDS